MADNIENYPTVPYFEDNEVITANKLNSMVNAEHFSAKMADDAKKLADDAKKLVNNANNTANDASTKAQTALDTANSTKSIADSASQIAQTASSNVSKAQQDAKNALDKINSYVDTTNTVTLNTDQTLTGTKTFTQPIVGTIKGNTGSGDLNSYTKNNSYFFSHAPNHSPWASPLVLLVNGEGTHITQQIYDINNNQHPRVRTSDNGGTSWTDWKEMGQDIDLTPYAQKGGTNTFTSTNTFIGSVQLKKGVSVSGNIQANNDLTVSGTANLTHLETPEATLAGGMIRISNNSLHINNGSVDIQAPVHGYVFADQNSNWNLLRQSYGNLNRMPDGNYRVLISDVSQYSTGVPVDIDTNSKVTNQAILEHCVSNGTGYQRWVDTVTGYVYNRTVHDNTWTDWLVLTPYS